MHRCIQCMVRRPRDVKARRAWIPKDLAVEGKVVVIDGIGPWGIELVTSKTGKPASRPNVKQWDRVSLPRVSG